MNGMILFETYDNDFSQCLLSVVSDFAWRVNDWPPPPHILLWLQSEDAVTTLSEAFAAMAYARACADVSTHIRMDMTRMANHPATLENCREYLGRIKIRVIDALDPNGYNGEAVVWAGDDLRIV